MGEWEILTLEEAGVKLLDCVHQTPRAAAFGIPYVAIPQMRNGEIILSGARKISEEDFREWTRKANPQPFDIVLSRRCNPGETAYVRPGMRFALGQNLVLLRADNTKVRPSFLRWIVRSHYWWSEIEKFLNVGAVFDSLRCADVPKFKVPVPPMKHQDAIAALLGSLDDKIDLNRRMNETLEVMVRAIFKDWFVDFGPTRAKMEGLAPYVAPEIWALFPDRLDDEGKPEGWINSTVGEHFRLTMGQSPPGDTYNELGDGLPFFQGRTDFGFRFPSHRIFCSAPTRIAEAGDTLVSVRAPVGDVNIAIERCVVGRGVAAVRHVSGSRSVTYHAMHGLAEHFDKFESEGTVFGSINKADFERLPFIEPHKAVVEYFDRIVSPIDDMVELNERESINLVATRDLLLPKLMSGEVRLREAEKIVEAVA